MPNSLSTRLPINTAALLAGMIVLVCAAYLAAANWGTDYFIGPELRDDADQVINAVRLAPDASSVSVNLRRKKEIL